MLMKPRSKPALWATSALSPTNSTKASTTSSKPGWARRNSSVSPCTSDAS